MEELKRTSAERGVLLIVFVYTDFWNVSMNVKDLVPASSHLSERKNVQEGDTKKTVQSSDKNWLG